MYRPTVSIGLALLWAVCSVSAAMGCHGVRGCGCRTCAMAGQCGCGPGGCGPGGCGPGGCDQRHDRYAARPYHHVNCRAARRDPRIPGPRIVSTLPRQPEMAAPSFFVPVPTYPVFGPRSEQPDGIDSRLQPVISDGEQFEAEPLPTPADESATPEEEEEADDLTDRDSSDLKLTSPTQTVATDGWKPKNRVNDAAASRPCAKCSVTFRPTNTLRH